MDRKKTIPPPSPKDEGRSVPRPPSNTPPPNEHAIQPEDGNDPTARILQELHDRIEHLQRQVEHYETFQENDRCTCPDEDFEVGNERAHVEAAIMYLEAAKAKANKDNEAKNTRRNDIMVQLSNLIADQSYITRGRISSPENETDDKKEWFDEWNDEGQKPHPENHFTDDHFKKSIHIFIEALTDQIMEIREPTTKDIADLLDSKKHFLKTLGYDDIAKERPEEFEKLLTACQAHSTIKTYLRKLTSDAMDMSTMNVPAIWREKWKAAKKDEDEERRLKDAFSGMAEKANEYCRIFFGEEGLHASVEQQNDIEELLKIVRTTLPDTPENYSLLASAVAKLNIMHLVDYIDTKVSFNRLKQAGEHIKKKIYAHTKRIPGGGTEFYCANDGNPDNYVPIHGVDMPDPKNDISIARKFISRDLQFTRDFRLEDIKDLLRFSFILTEEDSSSQQKIDRAITKIMGILLAMFGTDIPEDRLRYSFLTGSTNGNSTGKHRAFHFTFWYRIQCEGLGKNGGGATAHDMIPVEVQIRPFMFPEEVKADHKVYRDKKDAKIRKYMGMEVQYPEFIRNLCEAILYSKDYPERAKRHESYGFERPIKERWVLTLVSMLNRKGNGGAPANEYTIRKICESPFLYNKVMTILNDYANKESGIVRQQRDDIEEMRKEDRSVITRRYVKMLERKGKLNDGVTPIMPGYGHDNSSFVPPKYKTATDMDKIQALTNEEMIADMIAMSGGWRKELYEQIKDNDGGQTPFMETGLNILARRGIETLEEYQRKYSKTKQADATPIPQGD